MVHIRFQNIEVGTVSQASGVFSGNNRQLQYKNAAKENQAFGTVNGNRCSLSDIRATLDDRDEIDTLLESPDRP